MSRRFDHFDAGDDVQLGRCRCCSRDLDENPPASIVCYPGLHQSRCAECDNGTCEHQMRVVCGWCHVVLKDGDIPTVSHGICEACLQTLMQDQGDRPT